MNAMRLLVFGRTGQVATELSRLGGTGLVVTAVGRERADLSCPESVAGVLASADADVVINAAAYTAVDRAEAEEDLATRVNAVAPGVMARHCAERAIPFLHISTDYVFDGSATRAWREDDATGPLGAYGRSKLAGEDAVRSAGGPHAILRTAWVFSGHGKNFVRTMLKAGAACDELTVVDDQTGGPTAAADIAAALVTMACAFRRGQGVTGTFHYCGAPSVTWCGFAREIFRQAGRQRTPGVRPITTAEWPTDAARPANSVLDCSRIREAYGIEQPDWQRSLGPVLAELAGAGV